MKKFKKINISHQAFTFVEMLLVVSMIAIISIALFNTFLNGMKIWDRGYRDITEEDVSLFFEKFVTDLRNSVDYSLLPFEGKGDRISFATLERTKKDARKSKGSVGYVNEVGRVEYYFDSVKKALFRRQANYSQSLKKRFSNTRLLIPNVTSQRFQYAHNDNGDYIFEDFAEEFIPSIVSVTIEFGSTMPRKMQKLVAIPVGG